uniref:Uncharacterized protein n=1 Tax=Quercus lobata TaxID=97700 RepID=A0A7N2M0Q0_QUELO
MHKAQAPPACTQPIWDMVGSWARDTILDEMIFGGQVLETSSTELVKAVEEILRLESASNSITLFCFWLAESIASGF